MNILFENRSKAQIFSFSWVVSFIFVLPVIISNVYYRDDLERALTGIPAWTKSGRPLSDWIMNIVTVNYYSISDAAPLPLIFSTIAVALTVTYAVFKSSLDKNVLMASILLFIFINPFLLQNISYKYDSLPMTIGTCLAVFAYFYSSENKVKNIIFPSILLSMSMASYQSCANIFIGLQALNIIYEIKKYQSNKTLDTAYSILKYIIGVVIYYVVVFLIIGTQTERSNIAPMGQVYDYIKSSIYAVINASSYILGYETIPVVYFLLASLVIRVIYEIYLSLNAEKKWNYVTDLILVMVSPFILIFAVLGPTAVLSVGFSGYRTMQGSSALIILMLLSSYWLVFSRIKKLAFLMFIPVLFSLSTSSMLGNAIKLQRDYETRILEMAFFDISSLNPNDDSIIMISGTFKTAPMALKIVNKQRFLGRLLSQSEPWESRRIMKSFGIKNMDLGWGGDNINEIKEICTSGLNPIFDRYQYQIYRIDRKIFIWLKDTNTLCS